MKLFSTKSCCNSFEKEQNSGSDYFILIFIIRILNKSLRIFGIGVLKFYRKNFQFSNSFICLLVVWYFFEHEKTNEYLSKLSRQVMGNNNLIFLL